MEFIRAAEVGDVEAVQRLEDVRLLDLALRQAAMKGHVEVVRYLAGERGAAAEAPDVQRYRTTST